MDSSIYDGVPNENGLSLYAISIYARAVRSFPVHQRIPEDRVRTGRPEIKQVRRNVPCHFAWSVMARDDEHAIRQGEFRAMWMYPPAEGFVEWDVTVHCVDQATILAMLVSGEEYDWSAIPEYP